MKRLALAFALLLVSCSQEPPEAPRGVIISDTPAEAAQALRMAFNEGLLDLREAEIIADTLAFEGWVGLSYAVEETLVVLPMTAAVDGRYPSPDGLLTVVEWTMPDGRTFVWGTRRGEILGEFPTWSPSHSPSYLR